MSDNARIVIVVVAIVAAILADNMYNNYIEGQIKIAEAKSCSK